jgi:uncharacterized protein YgiM (DUF1202 family)
MTFKTITTSFLVTAALSAGSVVAQAEQMEVYDLTTKKHLNLRAAPSENSAIITGLHMGDVVTSAGCKDGWCEVETSKGTKGYASAKFLKAVAAAAAPEAAPAEAAPVAAKPAPYSVGKLLCERYNADPTKECDYGILRFGKGKARLIVVWPDATRRMFGIFDKVVTSGAGRVETSAAADGALTITLNAVGIATEKYVVPAALLAE